MEFLKCKMIVNAQENFFEINVKGNIKIKSKFFISREERYRIADIQYCN